MDFVSLSSKADFGVWKLNNCSMQLENETGLRQHPRAALFKKLCPLEINECSFTNLPEKTKGQMGTRTDSGEDEGGGMG